MLTWRNGEHRDRAALQQFLCTPAVRPRRWGRAAPPRPHAWELEAQSAIRDLRPPASPNALMLIGEDEVGIGAVGAAEQDSSPDAVFVSAIGVALRLRGGRVGLELMDEIVNWAAARADAAGHHRLTVWGKVDRRNDACHRLCGQLGAETHAVSRGLDVWTVRIDIE